MQAARAWAAVIGTALVGACSDQLAPTPALTVSDAAVAANPLNVLSAVVTFRATGADSARVLFGGGIATPHSAVQGDTGRIVVLGLAPGTPYNLVVEARGGAATVMSPPLQMTTQALPPDLARVTFTVSGSPPGGFILTSIALGATAYAIAFDETGSIRWYRGFPEGVLAGEIKQHLDGRFTMFLGNTFGWQPTFGRYVEFAPGGELTQSYTSPAPYYADNHELLRTVVNGQPRQHLFGYDLRRVDLTPIGGAADVLLAGHSILRLAPGGQVEFFWSGWDHFVLEDWIEEPASLKQALNIDFDHPNSLDFDRDGHYIASWRGLAEITKIHYQSGEIIWRLGGRNNQFTIINDPLDGFNGQHSVRVLRNGNLLVYDNGLRHTPPESRAVEYALDTVAMTATMVWQYRDNPSLYTPFTGSVQRRANGNTVIGFAGVGQVVEVTAAGAVVWRGQLQFDGQPTTFYRAIRIPSLYQYEEP